MKYLQSYERYQSGSVYKPVSDELTIDKCKELFLTNCKDYVLNMHMIQRDVVMPGNSRYLVDPKSMERKSRNTYNYYTYIIDNSTDWKDYPKRKNSIICTLSESNIREWLVIPYDGSEWGVCSVNDFWWGFDLEKIGISGLMSLNDDLKIIYETLFDGEELENSDVVFSKVMRLRDNTIEEFFECLDYLTMKISENLEDLEYLVKLFDDKSTVNNLKSFNWKLLNYLKKEGDVRIGLEKLLKPNSFQSMKYKDLMKNVDYFSTIEIWSDSKCLLVPMKDINMVKGWIKERLNT